MKYDQAISETLFQLMSENKHLILIGQGVTDFKGIWGTTVDCYKKFPGRVIETPIAEESVAGISIGASLNGLYPINSFIRADFSLLIFNQLINLASKYRYMYGGLFCLPMIFRLVIGRSWGQGAQHSQSIQSILSHFPGLTVLMPASPSSIIKTYSYSVKKYKNPVIILEHRLLYDLDFDTQIIDTFDDAFNPIFLERGVDITIVATSVMVIEAKRSLKYIKKMNISAELIDLNCISHINEDLIFESVKKTGRLLVIDTSWIKFGVAAEISRIISERNPTILKKPIKSLGMKNSPCPTSKILEDKFYPDVHDILNSIIELCDLKKNEVNISIPKKHSTTDFFKKFKGPF